MWVLFLRHKNLCFMWEVSPHVWTDVNHYVSHVYAKRKHLDAKSCSLQFLSCHHDYYAFSGNYRYKNSIYLCLSFLVTVSHLIIHSRASEIVAKAPKLLFSILNMQYLRVIAVKQYVKVIIQKCCRPTCLVS